MMARRVDPAAETVTVPGLYQHLIDTARRAVDRGDPRLTFGVDNPVERARLLAAAPPTGASWLLAKLERGDPVVVEAWRVDGRVARGIPWLCDRSVTSIRVTADDVIAPVESR
jgi:hypothetical protein